MAEKYLKNKKTGLVIDTTADYSKYLQDKKSVKALKSTEKELEGTKKEIATLKNELIDIKKLLQKLVNKVGTNE